MPTYEKKILGHIFNLGTGKAIKIKKIIEKIHNLTKKAILSLEN